MRYVDGFVVPVLRRISSFTEASRRRQGRFGRSMARWSISRRSATIWRTIGVFRSQRRLNSKTGEVPFFSFIVYKSRADRDKVNAKVMNDPRMKKMMEKGPMPFEVKRMVYGGFKVLVDI